MVETPAGRSAPGDPDDAGGGLEQGKDLFGAVTGCRGVRLASRVGPGEAACGIEEGRGADDEVRQAASEPYREDLGVTAEIEEHAAKERADPARQGEVQGVNQSFASLGRILGPFLGLFLFEQDVRRIAPYAMAVLTLGFVIVLLPMASRKQDS